MRGYFIFVFCLLIIMVLGVTPTQAQEQYFTDESDVRLPDTSVLSAGADAGDIDGDGNWDLCAGTEHGWLLSGPPYLLVNNGLGYFNVESDTRLPSDSSDSENCAFADIDWDGDLDLYICNEGFGSYQDWLYLNDGSGIFDDATTERLPEYEVPNNFVAFGDFTEDFHLDIFVQAGPCLWANDGLGYFHDVTSEHLPPDLFGGQHMAVGDIDNDLDLDVIQSYYENVPPYFFTRLLKNVGGGYFSDEYDDQLPSNRARYVAFGDIDLDGDLDVITSIGSYVGVWVNDGTGYYTDEAPERLPEQDGWRSSHLALGDFDNDGDLDFLLGCSQLCVPHLFINESNGYFSIENERLPDSQQSAYWVEPVDVDSDGDLDIFLACWGNGRQKLFINHSTPDSIPPNILTNTVLTGQVDSADVFPIYVSAWDNISVAIGELNGVLHYRVNGEDFIDLPMLPLGGTFFGEGIPGQPVETVIDYYIELIDRIGNTTLVPADAPDSVYSFVISGPVIVENQEKFPTDNDIIVGFPNPFNSSITLTIILPKGGDVDLEVFDVRGRLVKSIEKGGFLQRGKHRYTWDATDIAGEKVSSGIYFARMLTPQVQKSLKLIFVQ